MERLPGPLSLSEGKHFDLGPVEGVIANLSPWCAMNLIFRITTLNRVGPLRLIVPDLASRNLIGLGLALLLLRFHCPLWQVLAASALLSVAISAA